MSRIKRVGRNSKRKSAVYRYNLDDYYAELLQPAPEELPEEFVAQFRIDKEVEMCLEEDRANRSGGFCAS